MAGKQSRIMYIECMQARSFLAARKQFDEWINVQQVDTSIQVDVSFSYEFCSIAVLIALSVCRSIIFEPMF